MAHGNRRTSDQIQEEISAERAQLDTALAELGSGAKRTARVAGSALAAVGTLRLLLRLRARRR